MPTWRKGISSRLRYEAHLTLQNFNKKHSAIIEKFLYSKEQKLDSRLRITLYSLYDLGNILISQIINFLNSKRFLLYLK